MRKRLLPPLWVVSLLLAAVMGAMWIRGYRVEDRVRWGMTNRADTVSRYFIVNSSRGVIGIAWDRLAFEHTVPGFASAGDSFPEGRGLRWTQSPDPKDLIWGGTAPWWVRNQFSYGSAANFGTTVGGEKFTEQQDGAPMPAPVAASYGSKLVHFPWWLLVLPCWVLPLMRLRRAARNHRRRRRGQCLACGYDLRESPERCPECGGIRQAAAGRGFSRRIALVIFASGLIFACVYICFPDIQKVRRHQTPSWLDLGGKVYQEKDRFAAEKELLQFDPAPCWFEPNLKMGTIEESDADRFRTGDGKYLVGRGYSYSGSAYVSVPTKSPRPSDPMLFPEEQDGVRLTLTAAPSSKVGELLFTVGMSSRTKNIEREVEHRWTYVVPFLFAFYVDGRPLVLQSHGWFKFGGVQYFVPLIPGGSSQAWAYRVDGQSIVSLLPDSKPHTLDIFAAFGERQFEDFYAGEEIARFMNIRHPYPEPLLIRSNGTRLIWTGSQWEAGRFPDEDYRR